MIPTIDATYSGTNANSYIATVAEADEIASMLSYIPFVDFNLTAWIDANTTAKTVALVFGAKSLNAILYRGTKRLSTQSMEFPRIDMPRQQWNHLDGTEVIPDDIKYAQVIEAAYLLVAAQKSSAQQGIVSESIGDHSVTYSASHIMRAAVNVSEGTSELLRRSGLVHSGTTNVRIPRS